MPSKNRNIIKDFCILKRIELVIFLIALIFATPFVNASNSCIDLFKVSVVDLPASQHHDYDIADKAFIRAQNLIRLILTEKARLKDNKNWTVEQVAEVEGLFSQDPKLAKSVYRAAVDRVLEWESIDLVYITNQYLFAKYSALATENTTHFSLGPIPKNDSRWRSLLGGVLRVTGHLDLSLAQYGALSRVMTMILQEPVSTTSAEFRSKIRPILALAFPNTNLATDRGIAEMLANLAQEKSCCGHGCAGCFKYYVKTMITQITENARHKPSSLPLSAIIAIREENP